MKLIIGLGNHGKQYTNTRHNIGFNFIDSLLYKYQVGSLNSKFNGEFAKYKDVIFAKPMTFMNLSGDFVVKIANFFNIDHEDILVIHDDMDKELGTFVYKNKGGSGGQNGVKDIIQKLSSEKFNRLKIGIGRGHDSKTHVLGRFNEEEKQKISEISPSIIESLEEFMNSDILEIMNKFNHNK